jgi:hypothetical protein
MCKTLEVHIQYTKKQRLGFKRTVVKKCEENEIASLPTRKLENEGNDNLKSLRFQ